MDRRPAEAGGRGEEDPDQADLLRRKVGTSKVTANHLSTYLVLTL